MKISHIYKEMAAELAKYGLNISPEELAKITNLTTKFRKCKSCIGPSGRSPSNWSLYDRIRFEDITEDSITDIKDCQIENMDAREMVSDSETSQSLTPSLNNISPRIPSAERPTSSRGAKNKQFMEMFDKFGNAFEQAVNDDKKCTEGLLALEREKIKIFQNISASTEKLSSRILDFKKIDK